MPGNVHPPQFSEEPNNVIINEAATVGTIVTQVKVSSTGHNIKQSFVTQLFVQLSLCEQGLSSLFES